MFLTFTYGQPIQQQQINITVILTWLCQFWTYNNNYCHQKTKSHLQPQVMLLLYFQTCKDLRCGYLPSCTHSGLPRSYSELSSLCKSVMLYNFCATLQRPF